MDNLIEEIELQMDRIADDIINDRNKTIIIPCLYNFGCLIEQLPATPENYKYKHFFLGASIDVLSEFEEDN